MATGVSVLGAPFINRGRFQLFGRSSREYSALTLDLVRSSLVIDMLGLLTLDFKKLNTWQRRPSDFTAGDYERLRASGVRIFHPAVGYTKGDVYTASLADITGWNHFVAAHSGQFLRIDGTADFQRVREQQKIGVVIGQQNSEHFRTVEDVDRFYGMGQRVSQLTYDRNRIGGGSTDLQDCGLTGYGLQIVERMNRVGMAVDVSHCGDRTTLEAIEASSQPVLVTHSNCRVLVPASARCKTDGAIRKLAAKGGVFGVTMIRFFVRSGGTTTIEHVLDHMEHVAKLVGIEHVGLGTDVDLDGRDARAASKRRSDLDGIDYSRKIYEVTEGLLRRGYGKRDVELVLGENFQRALTSIWG